MANDNYDLMRALVLCAVRTAQQNAESATPDTNAPTTPSGVLEGIVMGKFGSELTEGKTLISSNEAVNMMPSMAR